MKEFKTPLKFRKLVRRTDATDLIAGQPTLTVTCRSSMRGEVRSRRRRMKQAEEAILCEYHR
jgi:hypothetical protein